MNTIRLPLAILLTACLSALSGCDSDSEEITATASESGETSSTSDTADTTPTSSETATETSTSDTATSTSGPDTDSAEGTDTAETDSGDSDDTDTGVLLDCADAQSEDACQDTETSACQWFPTTTVALDAKMMCGDLGFDDAGRCIAVTSEKNVCEGESVNNCDDGSGLFYLELGLEVGAVELLKMEPGSACDAPSDMLPCQLNSEPKPGSIPSYFPDACNCLCDVPS